MKNLVAKVKGDDKLVVSLVLIAVAIGLCIIFRNEIYDMMSALFESMTATVNNLFKGSVNGFYA